MDADSNSIDERKRKLQEIRLKAKAVSNESLSHESSAVSSTDTTTDGSPPAADHDSSEKKIRFRNYQPYDSTLKKQNEVSAGEPKDSSTDFSRHDDAAHFLSKSATQNGTTVSNNTVTPPEQKEMDILALELSKYKGDGAELTIIPKKINWDLKAQVEDRLSKLRTRTQRAIVELLREKITKEELDDDAIDNA